MKTILLILSSSFFASAVWSAEASPSMFLDAVNTNCKDATSYEQLDKKFENDSGNKNTYPGSNELYTCQGLTNNKIRLFYSQGNRQSYDFDWLKSILLSQGGPKCKEIAGLPDTDATKTKKITDLANELQEKYKKSYQSQILKCESVAYVLNRAKVDWEKPAHPKSEVKEFKQLSIKCSTSGLETLDYDSCVDFAESFENFEAVQNLGYQGQQLVYQEKLANEQAKVAEEQDAAKGALKATKVSMENQQDMYNQRAAVDGAKLAMLYSKFQEMPSNESILAYCNGFQNFTKIPESWNQDTCYKAVIGADARFEVLQNQAMRDKMKAKLIQVAASAGQNLIVAGLMGKRASDIDKALAKVDNFQPIDPFTVSEDEFLTTFCKQNPGAEKCLTGGLDRTIDGISDNVITFGEGATGTAYENPYNATTPTGSIDSSSSSTDKSPTKVGSVIAAAAQDNSMEGSTGATVKAGGSGGGSGGGGAAGGSSGGGGAGGGGGAASGQGQAQADARVATKAPSYGGGSGGLSVLGGFGINKAKTAAKDEGNPFGKLFDKDGAKSNLVNLPGERGIASTKVGDKNDDIFKMISNRYSSVKADKRLLEYELAK